MRDGAADLQWFRHDPTLPDVSQLRQYPAGAPALTDLRIRKYGARVSELLNTAEVAEILGVSDVTVGRLARSGELPEAKKNPGRTGGRVFDAAVVRLFLAHRKSPGARKGARGRTRSTEVTASCPP